MKKKHGTSLEGVTRHEFIPGVKKMGIKLKRLLTCRFEKRENKKLLKIVKIFGTASCLLHKVFKKCHRN